MKNINKILSFILAITLLGASFTLDVWAETETETETETAANDDYSKYEVRVLTDIGIIGGDEQTEQNMSRAEFAEMFAKFLNAVGGDSADMSGVSDVEDDYTYAPVIDLMLSRGYMTLDENRNFYPGGAITYSDAAKALIKALGYEPYVSSKNSGSYGYIKYANQIGIKLAGKSEADALTNGDVIHLLFSALEVSILEPKAYSSDKTEYTNRKGETPLSVWHDIYTAEGILYNIENGTASVSVDSIGKDIVRIGDGIYGVGKVNAAEFLGYAVKGYYYGGNKNTENELVSVVPLRGRNSITSIDAEKIVSFKNNTLVVEDAKRTKKYNISPSFDIIYNGEAVSSENRDKALNIDCGTVLINKLNYDGVNSIVIVTSYENYVVGAIDKERKIIYDKLDNNRALDLYGDDRSVKITEANGSAIDFESIKEGNILSVAESLGSKRISVIRSNKTISGNISASGGAGTSDEYIKVDDVTYYVAKNYRDSNAEIPKTNAPVSIFLDPWDKVAYIADVSSSGYRMAILKAVAEPDTWGSKGLSMKIFDLDGKMRIYESIGRVVIDNYRTKDAEEAKDVLTAVTGVSVYQPIRYMLNSDGMISNIDTTYWNEGAGESEDSLCYLYRSYNNEYTTRGYGADLMYKYWAGKNFGRKFYASQWATYMELPRQNTADDKVFSISSAWVDGRYYYVDALGVGRDNFCADIVIQYFDASNSSDTISSEYGLVTNVEYMLDDDEACAYKVTYIQAEGGEVSRFVDDSCDIDAVTSIKNGDANTYRVSEGDFVKISYDTIKKIVKADMIYDAETATWASDSPYVRSDRDEGIVNCNLDANELVHGYVLQNDNSYMRVSGTKPVEINDTIMNDAYVFMISNSRIYTYISEKKKLVASDASEIIPYQYSYDDCSEVITGGAGGATPFTVIYK